MTKNNSEHTFKIFVNNLSSDARRDFAIAFARSIADTEIRNPFGSKNPISDFCKILAFHDLKNIGVVISFDDNSLDAFFTNGTVTNSIKKNLMRQMIETQIISKISEQLVPSFIDKIKFAHLGLPVLMGKVKSKDKLSDIVVGA